MAMRAFRTKDSAGTFFWINSENVRAVRPGETPTKTAELHYSDGTSEAVNEPFNTVVGSFQAACATA